MNGQCDADLEAIQKGNPSAAEQLFPFVYAELRQLAAQPQAATGGRIIPAARGFLV